MRSLTGAASGPLAEVGSEDDDEQNCPAASGIGVYLFDECVVYNNGIAELNHVLVPLGNWI